MKKRLAVTLGEILGISPVDEDEVIVDEPVEEEADAVEATPDFELSDETVAAISDRVAEEAEKMRQAEAESDEAETSKTDALDEDSESEDFNDEIFEDESLDESNEADGSVSSSEDVTSAIIEKAEAERQKMREAHQRTLNVLKPVANPVVSKEEKMQTRKFYEQLGDMAYEFDRTGELDIRLADYVKSVIARDGDLVDEFMKKYLPEYINKNSDTIPTIESYIVDASEKNIPYRVMYHNPNTDEMFESWDMAITSIKDDLAKYPDIKPENVFRKLWFEIDADGNIGKEPVSEEEVEKYIDNFRGDKVALRQRLALPEKAKKPVEKQPKKPSTGKTAAGKKTGKKPTKNSSASSKDAES